MSRDGTFSYIHLDDPNKVLYIERWKDEPITYDDIETSNLVEAAVNVYPQLFAEEEEDDGILNFPSQQFGSKLYKNRRSIKQKRWMDLNIESFKSDNKNVVDKTLVPPVAGEPDLAEFLSNGYNKEELSVLQLSPGNNTVLHNSDMSLNSTSDYVGNSNNTFINMRSNSTSHQQPSQQQQQQQQQQSQFQTPRPGRVRQVSTDKFQTPVSRIMR
ncbi:hypothetical protein MG5_03945 [Candida albicans P57072]|uniref:Anaphase-promoting complex subunit 13 n=1 Tax=Candida albicans P78048 TaxID=1094989 RepID=A0AB34PRY0_CANAX|nr:hypothetical protein MG5_03945 [Candida albicans P57072]KGR09204.1 hypothetical protein MG3_03962 [Candida albicans P78048]KGT67892.1 hypothetical protein MEK_03944 [Candida albicans 12C]KGU08726.1 hypothetical protein MEM_03938 [Candida albicans L26]KHC34368.1 hypothetical protein MGQ_03913 [Candida albicans P76067]KHC76778.1 hypothetical protein W5Q_03994 [Candida albicans SC5314]